MALEATRTWARRRRCPAPPEHEVQELRKFKMRYGRPYVLVRWAGLEAAGDTWELLDNLTNCEAAITAFEQATGRSLPRPVPPPPSTDAASAPAPLPPAGYTVDAAPPGDLGAVLVGRTLLYWWPTDGWQRGTVARLCPRGGLQPADVGAARHCGHTARRRRLRHPLGAALTGPRRRGHPPAPGPRP